MSSSEEYLDSLLDSILGGGKPNGEEEAASGAEGGDNQTASADGGKAMSSQEIEEMLVSMGTLGGTEDESQESAGSEAEDMEAMLAFMNEHNASVSDSDDGALSLDGLGMEEGAASGDLALEEMLADGDTADGLDGLPLDDLDLGGSGGEAVLDDLSLDDLSLDDLGMEEDIVSDGFGLGETEAGEGMSDGLDDLDLDNLSLDDLGMEEGAASDGF
ncbi:MAG: hypothetical protein K2N39_10020, partial [Lachnospiraceae bacterium]|nr:hypothetical protein [Lachnospiraceae bacterium]